LLRWVLHGWRANGVICAGNWSKPHVDTELGAKDLLNSRMAYVSISRGTQDAQIFTNDVSALGKVLSHDVSHAAAIEPEAIMQKIAPQSVPIEEIAQELGIGL
jgi:hypothetical protein